jgi:glycerol kinase
MNVGRRPVRSAHDLLSTIAWGLGPGRDGVRYALEGSGFAAGAAVQWLRDGLGLIESAAEVGRLASTVEDNGGVYFVPALTGLGAPFWDPAARGLLIGLTRASDRGHVARATEEAICFQTRAVLEAMTKDAAVAPPELKVDGGATGDDFLMQLQADVLGVPVARQQMREATAFGAAALAGVGIGLWSQEQVTEMARSERVFRPADVGSDLAGTYETWLRAVERSRGWA